MAKDPRFPGFFQPGSPNVPLIILTDFTHKKMKEEEHGMSRLHPKCCSVSLILLFCSPIF